MEAKKTVLVTGGAGFIGSHLCIQLVQKYPDYNIINLDNLTYAGNLENLKPIEEANNYTFIKGDIANAGQVEELFDKYEVDGVIHLAAESHVDRSIDSPNEFALTNVIGTLNLLNAAKKSWEGKFDQKMFYHVSTD